MNCLKNHRNLPEWQELPYAQGNTRNERHKCAGCAYVEGIKDALNGRPLAQELCVAIPDSQAGSGRHKDAYLAYKNGYQYGLNLDS